MTDTDSGRDTPPEVGAGPPLAGADAPGRHPWREATTNFIACSIVGVTLLLLARQLWDPDASEVTRARDIAAILGPWVGVVIGYYFGARAGEGQAEAASAIAAVEKTKLAVTTGRVEAARPAVEDVENRLATLVDAKLREAEIQRELARREREAL